VQLPAASERPSLKSQKQELVRRELAAAAWELFARSGYESTTVAEIAAAAGVSRRTFFRYYATKEEVLVETSDQLAEAMLSAVARRPSSEPALDSIRLALTEVLEGDLAEPERPRTIIRLLRQSRSLRRAMLERHARMEERLAELLSARLGADPATDPTPALLAFVARAMMDTAFNVWYDQRREDVGALVEELFARLTALARGSDRA